MKAFLLAGLATGLSLVFAVPVSAHALGAECKVRGDRVEVEAYYDDDTPARNARVTVLGAGQETVAQGRTDARGRWTFPIPAAGSYQVVVNAGAGHLTKIQITVPAGSRPAAPGAGLPGGEDPDREISADAAPVVLSEGPSRAAFTRFPWLKVGIGLGVIGVLGLAAWLARRTVGRSVPPAGPGPGQGD
jgi:nickel transport protein